uniref:Uncharacterized protein n=1 Tax=Anopheles minimus TaxID=112268 RepID=A0A182WBE4_9DIPT
MLGNIPTLFQTRDKAEDEFCRWAVIGSGVVNNALILVKYGRTGIRAYQNRAMKFRNMAGAFVFWCLMGCLLAGRLQAVSTEESTVGDELLELGEPGTFTPEDLCRSLCGECQCRGMLVRENLCQCSCDFPPESAGGQNCTLQVQRLCEQMDVQCDFSGPEEEYVREPRGCHSMSCYEKHHEHDAGDYEGHYGDEGYGHDGGHEHGGKHLICCKDKKHKEKKHKHKKHKKFHDKHMKFHVVIKGKIPETSCHEGHEGGEHYGGYEEQEGYRAAMPDKLPINPAHVPMDVSVWTNRQKLGKKFPFRKPFQQQQHHHPQKPSPHYAPPRPAPYPVEPRGKSAEPPAPEPRPRPEESHPPSPPQSPPQPPPPPPPEPVSPPVTPFPVHPLTPPPNLYDGAPIGPKMSPQKPKQEPPKTHSFSPPPPPPPPPPPSSHFVRPSPPMITVDPPRRRIESSRSFEKPSYSSCQLDSYDFNYYHPPPTYHQPAPSSLPPSPPPPIYYRAPEPTVSSYRSYSSSYDSSYPSSHYHQHDEYDDSKHYHSYDEPAEYSAYDDSRGDSREYYNEHGVHPFSDNEIEDFPEFPPRDPADIFIYNQIVSRQIIEADTARRYRAKPFQPTPRPLRDEFEPPTAEVGPVLYDSFGEPDKNYEIYPAPTPPSDAFIPPVPEPRPPVEFPEAENRPPTFALNSEESLYPQPTPPPHYLLAKETGSMSSFGFEEEYDGYQPTSWGYGRSAAGPSHYRSAPSRSNSQSYRSYTLKKTAVKFKGRQMESEKNEKQNGCKMARDSCLSFTPRLLGRRRLRVVLASFNIFGPIAHVLVRIEDQVGRAWHVVFAFALAHEVRSLIIESDPLILTVSEWHLLLRIPHKRRVVHSEEGTDFVVAEKTGLIGELAWQTASGSRCTNIELRLVDERKRSSIRGHTDQQLLLRCTLFHPFARTVIHRQLLLIVGGRIQREERRIVSDLTFPLSVEIVRHHVDKVEVLRNLRYIVPGRDRFKRGRNCSGEQ